MKYAKMYLTFVTRVVCLLIVRLYIFFFRFPRCINLGTIYRKKKENVEKENAGKKERRKKIKPFIRMRLYV